MTSNWSALTLKSVASRMLILRMTSACWSPPWPAKHKVNLKHALSPPLAGLPPALRIQAYIAYHTPSPFGTTFGIRGDRLRLQKQQRLGLGSGLQEPSGLPSLYKKQGMRDFFVPSYSANSQTSPFLLGNG
ncbi:hypothetical protein CC77DRAFT_307496 [Alternaria alternata]|uniref:Uncharacterized protein n=1 Tax=Alternaria alternata TaxID=5599 RepID=A0A177DZS9_ALTAL|nr:hypothetical protein CC77DRAFT_307496 [Alternaria alternata]XP_051588754.1 uncharacterized protein J4E82_005297 [Alternaria postmessia]KAI5376051.1 hypothetical protein J4E82_005297 [Alternaria postmessia]OAG25223.1 hypothetical protein CC77DRAFT_307496 [Alternaria alternata]